MEILKTPRLILRTWTTSDVQDGYAIWGDPEVMKYVEVGESQTLELVRRSIEAGIRHQEKFGFSIGLSFKNSPQGSLVRVVLIQLMRLESLNLSFIFQRHFGVEATLPNQL